MTHLQTTRIALAIGAMAFIASCAKEPMVQKIKETNNEQKQSGDPDIDVNGSFMISTPSILKIRHNWEDNGATAIQGHISAAGWDTVVVRNNHQVTNQISFQRWAQYNGGAGTQGIGKTNGTINNGTATHAFKYKQNNWRATVPFAFGYRPNGGREAIWTPGFTNAVPRPLNMGEFVTDNGTGDEDNTTGIIEVGNFRARQLYIVSAGITRPRVSIEQWNGSSWVQIMRTDNPEGLSELLSFTVVKVRTNYTVSSSVSAPTTSDLPVFKAKRVGHSGAPFTGNEIQLWSLANSGSAGNGTRMVNSL